MSESLHALSAETLKDAVEAAIPEAFWGPSLEAALSELVRRAAALPTNFDRAVAAEARLATAEEALRKITRMRDRTWWRARKVAADALERIGSE